VSSSDKGEFSKKVQGIHPPPFWGKGFKHSYFAALSSPQEIAAWSGGIYLGYARTGILARRGGR